jgi:acid phosphatase (class A)
MKSRIGLLLFCLLFLSGFVRPSDTAFNYLRADGASWQQVIPSPPAPGSPETKSELAHILKLQQARTSEQVARAQSEAQLKPEAFATVLGDRFNRKNSPAIFALLDKVEQDAGAIIQQAKAYWNRPRPPLADSRIKPCVELPNNTAYPSGHTALAYTWATVLGEIFPGREKDLLARAEQIGQDRIIAGVHHPSDVAAGRQLGLAIAAQMDASPVFRIDLIKARAETKSVLSTKPPNPSRQE